MENVLIKSIFTWLLFRHIDKPVPKSRSILFIYDVWGFPSRIATDDHNYCKCMDSQKTADSTVTKLFSMFIKTKSEKDNLKQDTHKSTFLCMYEIPNHFHSLTFLRDILLPVTPWEILVTLSGLHDKGKIRRWILGKKTATEYGQNIHISDSCLRVVKIRCVVQGYVVQGKFIVVGHYRDADGECQIIWGYSVGLKISQ